jgi:hypothetical protein
MTKMIPMLDKLIDRSEVNSLYTCSHVGVCVTCFCPKYKCISYLYFDIVAIYCLI